MHKGIQPSDDSGNSGQVLMAEYQPTPLLSEIAEEYPDDILHLADIYGADPIRLYRGTRKSESGIGLFWTPNKNAAGDYAERHDTEGIIRELTLSPVGLSCWVMPYTGKNWSYQHLDCEVALELTGRATPQRKALTDAGYEMDLILVANDLSYEGRKHHSFLIVSDKALGQTTMKGY